MIVLIAIVLVCGLCWLIMLSQHRQPTSAPEPHEEQRRAALARQYQQQQEMQRRRLLLERQQAQLAADQRQQLAARNMQVAMLQIEQSLDFRRAASYAVLAREVPLAFRQQQFRRLRPLLLRHLVARLQSGQSIRASAKGLGELVTALGIAKYEADYLIAEASAAGTLPAPAPVTFTQLAQKWQADLQQRSDAIQSLTNLDTDLREQLLEQEQQRFRERLLSASDSMPSNG